MSENFSLTQCDSDVRLIINRALKYTQEENSEYISIWHFVVQLMLFEQKNENELLNKIQSQGVVFAKWEKDLGKKIEDLRGTSLSLETPQADQELGEILHKALEKAQKKNRLIQLEDLHESLLENETFLKILIQNGYKNDQKSQKMSEILNEYCTDLTQLAREGRLDKVIGRDDEMREAMNILQRRTQNNPLFVGDTGVGKTALVNGLAQRMVTNEVPERMKNKRLLSLNVVDLLSGRYKNDMEKRIKSLTDALLSETDVLLFIDDIHLVLNRQGETTSLGQILKPMISRGDIRCLGTTTTDEYKLYLEKDVMLSRRFQKIDVNEPSLSDSIAILRGLKDTYALHHNVDITDSAIVASVELSSRYMTDRFLPEKAIDLMDAAAARVRTTLDSKPEKLEKEDRKLIQLKGQRETLKKEERMKGELDKATADRLSELEHDIQTVEEHVLTIEQQWEKEKIVHQKLHDIREKILDTQKELIIAKTQQDLVKISTLQHGKIPELEKELRENQKVFHQTPHVLLHDQVEFEQIAEVVSKRTGIPVTKMSGGEKERLNTMEEIVGKKVIGQPEAVESISDAVRRSRSGLSDPNKPIGSFLFMGPTGVGKTELTKVLSEFLFEQKDAMIRIDMSEFMEKHALSRLIGAPPGYVGYEEGGMLTEAVKRKPYSVVLLDEVEKAHPDIFNLLLQVLDDGHLTDGKGRLIDFKNTVIIMTSNLGANDIQELTAQQKSREEIKEAVMEKAKEFFRPEFINRLDETIVFRPLDRSAIEQIAHIQIKKVIKRLNEQNMNLTISPQATTYLADIGFDPLMGARPLKRAIQQELENSLAKKITGGLIKEHDHVYIDLVEGELSWKIQSTKLATQLSDVVEKTLNHRKTKNDKENKNELSEKKIKIKTL